MAYKTDLGEPRYDSPLGLSTSDGDLISDFINDDQYLPINPVFRRGDIAGTEQEAFELAGPRARIFFDPDSCTAALVTCGGLCPGFNAVIRAIVMEMWHRYHIRRILGVPYGFQGMTYTSPVAPLELQPGTVRSIHHIGGTILGTSRGPQDPAEMMQWLIEHHVNLLFIIGGDGTMRGALALLEQSEKRSHQISIIGVPKTIDNDIAYLDRSFGFHTAVTESAAILSSAHTEATSVYDGIGLVKLMGRLSGFIAAESSLASGDVNFVLIPEVPFDLEGDNGLLHHLAVRLNRRHHALIVVAEGAGQSLFEDRPIEKDASGNIRLHDIGEELKRRIIRYFTARNQEVIIRYFDPSYYIRSVPPTTIDTMYCTRLAQNAVHAALAGKTAVISGCWNNHYVYVPMHLAISHRKQVNPEGNAWLSVVESTGQPFLMINKK